MSKTNSNINRSPGPGWKKGNEYSLCKSCYDAFCNKDTKLIPLEEYQAIHHKCIYCGRPHGIDYTLYYRVLASAA